METSGVVGCRLPPLVSTKSENVFEETSRCSISAYNRHKYMSPMRKGEFISFQTGSNMNQNRGICRLICVPLVNFNSAWFKNK